MSAKLNINKRNEKLIEFIRNIIRETLKEDNIVGGKGDKLTDKDVDPKELKMGIKVELEHTKDPNIAKEIALDHLAEDPKYYSKLKSSGLADELSEMINNAVKSDIIINETLPTNLAHLLTSDIKSFVGMILKKASKYNFVKTERDVALLLIDMLKIIYSIKTY